MHYLKVKKGLNAKKQKKENRVTELVCEKNWIKISAILIRHCCHIATDVTCTFYLLTVYLMP